MIPTAPAGMAAYRSPAARNRQRFESYRAVLRAEPGLREVASHLANRLRPDGIVLRRPGSLAAGNKCSSCARSRCFCSAELSCVLKGGSSKRPSICTVAWWRLQSVHPRRRAHSVDEAQFALVEAGMVTVAGNNPT